MFEIGITTHFSAAHHLVGYAGSCATLHGHNWEVEVFVEGAEVDAAGMLLDFRELKAQVKAALADIDHSDLNAAEAFRIQNPTSENLARHLFRRLAAEIDAPGRRVSRVRVRETPTSVATYRE